MGALKYAKILPREVMGAVMGVSPHVRWYADMIVLTLATDAMAAVTLVAMTAGEIVMEAVMAVTGAMVIAMVAMIPVLEYAVIVVHVTVSVPVQQLVKMYA